MHSNDEKMQQEYQLVTFKVGKEEFSIPIQHVHEIIRMCEITHVPHAPDIVEGVINLRGKVIPVIDARRTFGMTDSQRGAGAKIIIADSAGKLVGLIVDSVSEVLNLPAGSVEPAPEIVEGVKSEYIKGVGKLSNRLIILLDLDNMLSKKDSALLVEIK